MCVGFLASRYRGAVQTIHTYCDTNPTVNKGEMEKGGKKGEGCNHRLAPTQHGPVLCRRGLTRTRTITVPIFLLSRQG